MCQNCRKSETDKKSRRNATRRLNNQCILCKAPNVFNNNYCELCKDKRRKYYATKKLAPTANKTILQVSQRALWKKAKGMRTAAVNRAKIEGAKCNIPAWHIHDILKNGRCELTGLPFVFGEKTRWDSNNPNYTKDNTRVVVWALNRFKFRWDEKDWLFLLDRCLIAYGLIPNIECEAISSPLPELDSYKLANWYKQTKHRAKKENVLFEFTLNEFKTELERGYCQVTKIPFDFSGLAQPDFSLIHNPRAQELHCSLYPTDSTFYSKEPNTSVTPLKPNRPALKKVVYNPWVPSIDRIDPANRNYSKDNTQFVCWAYNAAKGNLNKPDFITLLKAKATSKESHNVLNSYYQLYTYLTDKHLYFTDSISYDETWNLVLRFIEKKKLISKTLS